MAKLSRPKKNSLWSRKDARRPGIVRVTKITKVNDVYWTDENTGRKGVVWVRNWHRLYRPFEAPTEGTPTTGGEK